MRTATKGHHDTKGKSLSPAQREELRRALKTRKAQLVLACEHREEEVTEAEVETGDVADVAEGVIEDRQRAALDEHDRAILGEIEHALARLDAGTYGTSEKSGHPIPFERLRAVPWARYDAEEEERLEHGLLR